MASLFESYERRIDKINAVLAQYGINGVEDAKAICAEKGLDPYKTCEETQPICFENAKWAYVVGAAIAIKKGDSQTTEAVQKAMQKLMDDGTYTKILQHWGVESGALDKAEINPAVE